MKPPATLEAMATDVQLQLPALASGRLQALILTHARVTSRRHLERVASQDGTVHHFPDGPVMRVRTEQLTPVPPPLERTP